MGKETPWWWWYSFIRQESYPCPSPTEALRKSDPLPLLGCVAVLALVEGIQKGMGKLTPLLLRHEGMWTDSDIPTSPLSPAVAIARRTAQARFRTWSPRCYSQLESTASSPALMTPPQFSLLGLLLSFLKFQKYTMEERKHLQQTVLVKLDSYA